MKKHNHGRISANKRKYIRTRKEVKDICKEKYKKGIFDFSRKWKIEFDNIMNLEYRDLYLWIENNSTAGVCCKCGKENIWIACPDHCIKCYEIYENDGYAISEYTSVLTIEIDRQKKLERILIKTI